VVFPDHRSNPVPSEGDRTLAPGNAVADFWMTRPECKIVLAVGAHLQSVSRILDILPVLEADYRVQVLWTVPATGYHWAGVAEYIRSLGGLVIPWSEALDNRYDLGVAADSWGVTKLRSPTIVLPHGAGRRRSRLSPWGEAASDGLGRSEWMNEDQVVPSALVLANDGELAELANACPEALPQAVVAGDPCFDRMLAGRPLRRLYREALGVQRGQKLVVVSTTWSPHSLFGSDPTIFARLVTALSPDNYRVIAILHPFIWHGHSRRQVLAWLTSARAAGLVVLPPEEGWRAAVVAADVVIGDQGSLPQYAAGLDVPVLMNSRSLVDVRPGSGADMLAKIAAPLDTTRPLAPQVEQALEQHTAETYAEVAEMISSRPGQSMEILRRTCYRLLELEEPAHHVRASAVPFPCPIG
jgi:hypothetical protein